MHSLLATPAHALDIYNSDLQFKMMQQEQQKHKRQKEKTHHSNTPILRSVQSKQGERAFSGYAGLCWGPPPVELMLSPNIAILKNNKGKTSHFKATLYLRLDYIRWTLFIPQGGGNSNIYLIYFTRRLFY